MDPYAIICMFQAGGTCRGFPSLACCFRSVFGVRCTFAGQELHRSEAFRETRVAVASRCDEPEWGRECLKKFMVEEGVSMWDVAEKGHLVEIYKSSSSAQVHNYCILLFFFILLSNPQ